jgi:glutamine cyclotransferase
LIRDCAHLPVRRWQAWLALLCILAVVAACAPPFASAAKMALALPPTALPLVTGTGTALPTTSSPVAMTSTSPPTALSLVTMIPTSLPTAWPPVTMTPIPQLTASAPRALEAAPVYGYRVVNEYPHDPEAFTQGLVYEDGIFYEGTGLRGESSLRKVALETGEVLQIHNLESDYFGEGISVVGNRIWQLTWTYGDAFLYDKETFEQLDTVEYPTEGWGLTYDGERLIMSDGTATLYFRDPATFELLGQVPVHDEQGPVVRLNELEYIDGLVYANVWQTDRVAIIDPASGQVVAWIDLGGLLQLEDPVQVVDVLNGIAYDAANERLFVTGKLWPKLFEIELVIETVYLPLIARQEGLQPAGNLP